MVRVEVIGEQALMAKFERSKAIIAAEKPILLRKSGLAIHSAIRGCIHEMFQERTGNLARSVRVFGQTKNGVSIGTGKGLDYVQPLEFGSIPHKIFAGGKTKGIGGGQVGHYGLYIPGGASMLHFVNSYGEEVFVRSVNHPGNRPYRFVYKGTMDAMPTVYGYNREFLAKVLQVPM